MGLLGIIGGTGLDRLDLVRERDERPVTTPYGAPSAPLVQGRIGTQAVVFLARHGHEHTVAPHEINYRANLRALHDAGVTEIVAVAAVGGIADGPVPGGLVIPDQLIDYTHDRPATFHEGPGSAVEHVDFTWPYTTALRRRLLEAAAAAGIDVLDGGCYGATQGPRLETAAEIARLERDGCTLVGMTGMPEAVLARELGVDYACCAVIANQAAGKSGTVIAVREIETNLRGGMDRVRALLEQLGHQ